VVRKLPAKVASQLYAAAELIAERGLDGARMEEIADVTGVPKATLYYHLDGKNAVLEFLLTDFLELIGGAVGVAVTGPETARERLGSAITAQLAVMLEHPHLCRALVGDLGRATRLPELAVALDAAFLTPIEELLLQGVEDGSLRAVDDPATVAASIFGAVTVTGLSVTAGMRDATGVEVSHLSSSIQQLLTAGLATRPAAHPPVPSSS